LAGDGENDRLGRGPDSDPTADSAYVADYTDDGRRALRVGHTDADDVHKFSEPRQRLAGLQLAGPRRLRPAHTRGNLVR
jgi:hypothetical protein